MDAASDTIGIRRRVRPSRGVDITSWIARSTAASAMRKPSSLRFGPAEGKWDIMGITNRDLSGLMEHGFHLFLEDGLDLLLGVVVGRLQRPFGSAGF